MSIQKTVYRLILILTLLALSTGTVLASSSTPAVNGLPKLSSRLQILAARSQSPQLQAAGTADQAQALSLPPSGPGSLMQNGSGAVMVYIRTSDLSPSALDALRASGAQIVHVSKTYQVVTAYVPASSLLAVAGQTAVLGLHEEFTPQTGRVDKAPASSGVKASASACPQGAAVTEGDAQLKASQARTTYGLDGSGVTVGILSDSFDQSPSVTDHALNDMISGDLPGLINPCGDTTPVNQIAIASNPSGVVDEGRGMLQIVHDIAPKATLAFASAWNGVYDFGDQIRKLRNNAHADIIADDIFYYAEPFFQEGPVNVGITDVVNSGAAYFALGGNHNIIVGGQNVSSYEAPTYRPTTCPLGITGMLDCHNFATSGPADAKSDITLGFNGVIDIDFQWAEPWNGVTTDFDIFLLNGTDVIGKSEYNNFTIQWPFERFYYQNNSGISTPLSIVIGRKVGSGTPRLKYIFTQNSHYLNSVKYNTSSGGDIVGPTLYGHSSTTSGISVAAVPFNDSTIPESFTSRGPATFYFGPVVGANASLSIAPQIMNQPDLAATDGGCTTFFGQHDFSANCYRFYGTSAATPHAAAVAALLQQNPKSVGLPLNQATIKSLLMTTAQNIPFGTTDAIGAGLVDALGAATKMSIYTVSGRVTVNGVGLAGVTVSNGEGLSTITALDGSYTLPKMMVGKYSFSAYKWAYAFSPFTQPLTITASTPNINFSGIQLTHFNFLPSIHR